MSDNKYSNEKYNGGAGGKSHPADSLAAKPNSAPWGGIQMCKPEIKICGIRRSRDVDYLNRYLPQYAGFVFAESKRKVSIEIVNAITANLDDRIKKVGVFVNEEIERVIETMIACSLDVLQLHGDENNEYLNHLRTDLNRISKNEIQVWKAIRVKDEESFKQLKGYNTDGVVLDTFNDGNYGGAGKVFDWTLAVNAKRYGKIILAGGLNCENIASAVERVQPFAVDVSSGVETDGFKDETKIRDFINSVRGMKRQLTVGKSIENFRI